jgi:hypothetical protein
MRVERVRDNVFTVTATGQELSALVAGARMALDVNDVLSSQGGRWAYLTPAGGAVSRTCVGGLRRRQPARSTCSVAKDGSAAPCRRAPLSTSSRR